MLYRCERCQTRLVPVAPVQASLVASRARHRIHEMQINELAQGFRSVIAPASVPVCSSTNRKW
jgi:hypothetical protein